MRASNIPGAPKYQDLLAQLNALYGMDKSIFQGFLAWAGNAVKGQLR